jgi:hypothetical protein
MTEAIVDRLETVEIDHRERAGRRRVADAIEERPWGTARRSPTR